MPTSVSVFLDFNLPNATTWFYFSLLLTVALFFKFARLLCVRNLDVVMMFLPVPGLLIVIASRPQPMPVEQEPTAHILALIGNGAGADTPGVLAAHVARFSDKAGPTLQGYSWLWVGYLWLLVASLYFFCRCIFDLTLAQRPALAPNLQIGGLGWLAGALLICLLAVAFRQVERHINPLPILATPAHPVTPILHPPEQSAFAVALLWRDWPAWAVAALAFAGHVTVVVALVLICWRHFQDLTSGVAAATFYLMLPYTGAFVGQLTHVLPMALFLGAVLAYRQPMLAGAILGVATAATYFPVFVLPIWLSFYRARGMGRFLLAFLLAVALGGAGLAAVVAANGEWDTSIKLTMHTAAWQPWKPLLIDENLESFWSVVPGPYRIPIFVLFLSFVVATMFWPTPKNLAHVIALSAAVFISLQWWSADQGGLYILWYVPLLLLLMFRPNLQDRTALPIQAETDWLWQSLRWCGRRLRRWVKAPESGQTETAATAKNGQNHSA